MRNVARLPESVRYKNMPSRFKEPEKRPDSGIKAPKRRK